ncbi:uracil-DNA glycosylase [Ideonella sp. TBM-1]|uniref:Type-4 uracil-DNA glycosylase n=2 Tax=Ideonella livida TaxID=2707176 RepID=A0A7C9PGA0_9BURK|nr:uracil-DNA glycosylase [Ideonella livida]
MGLGWPQTVLLGRATPAVAPALAPAAAGPAPSASSAPAAQAPVPPPIRPPAHSLQPRTPQAPERPAAVVQVEAVRSPAPAAPAAPEAPDLGSRPSSALSGLDWPALEAAVAGCERCGLCRSRRQTVFGAGVRQASWMLVGEAPGEQEDLRGEPFVGPAGALLDAMLASIGRSREADAGQPVYIANTLKCRPPGNRNPTPEELAQCRPYLDRQIELVAPRLILALGRFAAQAVLGVDEPIGKLRGRVHRRGQTPVIVSYHPSYLLRQPGEKAKAWEDLCLAAAQDPQGD